MAEAGIVSYGTGRVEAAPDTVVVHLGTEAKAFDPNTALAEAGERAAAVLAALAADGVSGPAVRTEHANVHENWEPPREPGPGATAEAERRPTFVASTGLSVRLAVGSDVEAIIDRVAGAAGGAFRMQGLSYSLEDPGPVRAEAAALAVAAALRQAATLAEAAGVTLGAVRRVEEVGPQGGGGGGMRPMAMAAERSKLASAPIEAGAETVSVTVLVEHALA